MADDRMRNQEEDQGGRQGQGGQQAPGRSNLDDQTKRGGVHGSNPERDEMDKGQDRGIREGDKGGQNR